MKWVENVGYFEYLRPFNNSQKVKDTSSRASAYLEQDRRRDRCKREGVVAGGELRPRQAAVALVERRHTARGSQLPLLRLGHHHAQERVDGAGASQRLLLHQRGSGRRRLSHLALESSALFAHLEDCALSRLRMHLCL